MIWADPLGSVYDASLKICIDLSPADRIATPPAFAITFPPRPGILIFNP